MTPPRSIDPAFAMTEDIMRAAGISRQTVTTWVAQGLLPTPTKVSQGSPGGVFNRFPAWAIDRARFVAQRRAAGYTTAEVLEMLAELDARQGLNQPQPSRARGSGRK